MRTLNKVFLMGNLGKDAEAKFTQSGISVATFSIATSRRVKEASGEYREETDWHNCVLWRNENVIPYLLKGKPVVVEGHLQSRSWETKDGQKRYATEVVVDELILAGGGGAVTPEPGLVSKPRGRIPAAASQPPPMEITEDDIPF